MNCNLFLIYLAINLVVKVKVSAKTRVKIYKIAKISIKLLLSLVKTFVIDLSS